jgi:hypothetical protein
MSLDTPSNSTGSTGPSVVNLCPAPFLPLDNYPAIGGYIDGRFCGPVTPTVTCCLPCPLQHWVSSDTFEKKTKVAFWFNIPAILCQVFLLLTFAVLPKESSGRHYLSYGLCCAMILLEVRSRLLEPKENADDV